MLGSLLLSLTSVAALPGFARRARQVEAPICPAATTITSYVPIITTIAECQGNICSINTIISQGQSYVTSTLTDLTTTGSSGQVIGGTTFVNNGAVPTNAIYSTFTSCASQCTVAGITYGSGDVFYSTSASVGPSSTSVFGGETLQGTSTVLTIPTAVTLPFYSATLGNAIITDGSIPVTTTLQGANGVPTTIVQPASQVIVPTPAITSGQTATQTITVITPASTGPITIIVVETITIGTDGQPTTVASPGSGPAGIATISAGLTTGADGQPTPVSLSGTVTGTIAVTTGANGIPTPVTLPGAGSGPDGMPTGSSGLPASVTSSLPQASSVVSGSNTFLDATSSASGAAPPTDGSSTSSSVVTSAVPTTTTIPCASDADCTAVGLDVCLDITGAPLTAGASLGVCASISSSSQTSPVVGSSATSSAATSATQVPCVSNQDCVAVGLGACLDVLGDQIGTNVGLSTGNCAQVSPIGQTSSSSAALPTSTAVACTNSDQCSGLNLGVCLDVLGVVVVDGSAGFCSGTLPTSGVVPTISIGLSETVSLTLPAVLPPSSSAVIIAASDLLNEASTAAAQVSSIISGILGELTATTTGSLSLPTSISCQNDAQCSGLGLGLCVRLPGVLTTEAGICALGSTGSGSIATVSASVSLDNTNLLPSITLPGAGIPGSTSVPTPSTVACTTDSDCSSRGLGACVGVNVPGLVGAKVCVDANLLTPGGSSITASASASLPVATGAGGAGLSGSSTSATCTDNSDCSAQGLSICASVQGLVGVNVCVDSAILGGSSGASSVAGSQNGAQPTINVGFGSSSSNASPGATQAPVTCTSDAECAAGNLGVCVFAATPGLSTGICAEVNTDGTGPLVGAGAGVIVGSQSSASATVDLGAGDGAASQTQSATTPTGSTTNIPCTSDAECIGSGLTICVGLSAAGLGTGVCANVDLTSQGLTAGASAGVNAGNTPVVVATADLGNGQTATSSSTSSPTTPVVVQPPTGTTLTTVVVPTTTAAAIAPAVTTTTSTLPTSGQACSTLLGCAVGSGLVCIPSLTGGTTGTCLLKI